MAEAQDSAVAAIDANARHRDERYEENSQHALGSGTEKTGNDNPRHRQNDNGESGCSEMLAR